MELYVLCHLCALTAVGSAASWLQGQSQSYSPTEHRQGDNLMIFCFMCLHVHRCIMYMYVHVRVYEWLQEVEELQAQLEPLKAQLASYQGLPPVSNHNCRYMYMYM